MCPESLHVYRRMGTARNASLVHKAMRAPVDLIQSANVPNVMADHGYALLVDEVAKPRDRAAQAEYERTLQTALEPFASTTRNPLHLPAQVQATTAPAGGLAAAVGDLVLVPRTIWPAYACKENSGRGWTARITARTTRTAVVEFVQARTPDGRPYLPERLPLELLETC